MKVLIAIDSFKGSLSSAEAGDCVKEAIKDFVNEAEVVLIADGGEGSVEAMMDASKAKIRSIQTKNPLNKDMMASYGISENLAIMEMASSCGLTLLEANEKNPLFTSTYGLGLMIKDAIDQGIKNFIIGIGGSSTNDAGTGMLSALGFEFLDSNDEKLEPIGKNLINIKKIVNKSNIDFSNIKFQIACDVNNPLFGLNGAAHVYGPQKGANQEDVIFLDDGLKNFAEVTKEFNGSDYANYPGAGAAGGLGFGFVSFLNADLKPGFKIIADLANLEDKISKSDLVITGEGALDFQSTMGKTPDEVAKIAKKYNKKVIAFGGIMDNSAKNLNNNIDACFSIINSPIDITKAMDKKIAYRNLFDCANQVIRLFKA